MSTLKQIKTKISLLIILCCSSYTSFAYDLPFNTGNNTQIEDDLPPTDDPPIGAPIDEGILFLFVSGLLLSSRVFYKLYKNGASSNTKI